MKLVQPCLNTTMRLFQHLSQPLARGILALKNTSKGESCYIVGDGISLKWFDLSAFPVMPTFSLSYIPFHRQAKSLDLRYCLLTEPYYFYPFFKLPWHPKTWWRNRIQESYRQLIKAGINTSFFVNLSNYPVLRGSNIYYLFRNIVDYSFEFQQECNSAEENIYGGSLRCAITLAIYMGFKDIYLIGCDYTHKNAKSLHWYEKGSGVLTPMEGYSKNFFRIAQKFAAITTITIDDQGSQLPALTYNEFTGREPSFQENHQLLDQQTLALLSSWPGYTIF